MILFSLRNCTDAMTIMAKVFIARPEPENIDLKIDTNMKAMVGISGIITWLVLAEVSLFCTAWCLAWYTKQKYILQFVLSTVLHVKSVDGPLNKERLSFLDANRCFVLRIY